MREASWSPMLGGHVIYVPILPNGRAGHPTIVIADPARLFGLDGITMVARGDSYGAANVGTSRDGTEIPEFASSAPLHFLTGEAFGTGRGAAHGFHRKRRHYQLVGRCQPCGAQRARWSAGSEARGTQRGQRYFRGRGCRFDQRCVHVPV